MNPASTTTYGLVCDVLLGSFHGRDLICRHTHFPRFSLHEPVSLANPIPGDLRQLRVQRRKNVRDFVEKFFGYPSEKQNYWRIQQRMNKTFRPQTRCKFSIKEADAEETVEDDDDLERSGNVTLFVCGCPNVENKKVLLFIKYYDESKTSLDYLGHIHADGDQLLIEVLRSVCPSYFDINSKFVIWEEICPKDSEDDVRPFVEMEDKNLSKTITENELTSGDLLVLERMISPQSSFKVSCTSISPTLFVNSNKTPTLSRLQSLIRDLYNNPLCSDITFRLPLAKADERVTSFSFLTNSSLTSASTSLSTSSSSTSSSDLRISQESVPMKADHPPPLSPSLPSPSPSLPSSPSAPSFNLLPSSSSSSAYASPFLSSSFLPPPPSLLLSPGQVISASPSVGVSLRSLTIDCGHEGGREKAKETDESEDSPASDLHKTFYAHKIILSQFSYFRAMFSSGLKESHAKEMTITRPSAGVFECILKYIYFFASQSEPPSDEKFEQLLQSSGATIEELFETAHLYDIQELLELAKRTMVRNLSLGTWLPTLLLLHRHLGETHIDGVLNYVVRNLSQVMMQNDYLRLGIENPQIFKILANHLNGIVNSAKESTSPPRKRVKRS